MKPVTLPSGNAALSRATASLTRVSLEDAMATRTFSARADLATEKPIPDDPPMIRIDCPEIDGIVEMCLGIWRVFVYWLIRRSKAWKGVKWYMVFEHKVECWCKEKHMH